MYRVLFVGSLVASLIFLGTMTLQAEEIHWTNSPQNAVDTAHGSGRMILISVHAQSCQFCKKMDYEVWQDPAVAELVTQEFVPLRLTQSENSELIQKLQVSSFPATFIFSTDRRPLARLDGFVSTSELKSAIQRIRTTLVPKR